MAKSSIAYSIHGFHVYHELEDKRYYLMLDSGFKVKISKSTAKELEKKIGLGMG